MADETQETPAHSTGIGIKVNCPDCGEPLWVFVPTEGAARVMRASDFPSEEEDDIPAPEE